MRTIQRSAGLKTGDSMSVIGGYIVLIAAPVALAQLLEQVAAGAITIVIKDGEKKTQDLGTGR